MNEKLNLVEILKNCPKGTKLYSTIFGDVKFEKINNDRLHPITVRIGDGCTEYFTADGKKYYGAYNGECTLFPSKDQRDWSKFNTKKTKQPKFDPKTLQPFDKVLVRDKDSENWNCGFFSHKDASSTYPYRCIGTPYMHCIPYNDDTKHLVGTTEEAPEFYKYWED